MECSHKCAVKENTLMVDKSNLAFIGRVVNTHKRSRFKTKVDAAGEYLTLKGCDCRNVACVYSP